MPNLEINSPLRLGTVESVPTARNPSSNVEYCKDKMDGVQTPDHLKCQVFWNDWDLTVIDDKLEIGLNKSSTPFKDLQARSENLHSNYLTNTENCNGQSPKTKKKQGQWGPTSLFCFDAKTWGLLHTGRNITTMRGTELMSARPHSLLWVSPKEYMVNESKIQKVLPAWRFWPQDPTSPDHDSIHCCPIHINALHPDDGSSRSYTEVIVHLLP